MSIHLLCIYILFPLLFLSCSPSLLISPFRVHARAIFLAVILALAMLSSFLRAIAPCPLTLFPCKGYCCLSLSCRYALEDLVERIARAKENSESESPCYCSLPAHSLSLCRLCACCALLRSLSLALSFLLALCQVSLQNFDDDDDEEGE